MNFSRQKLELTTGHSVRLVLLNTR